MKAIVYTQYGSPDVLELKEVEKPTLKDNEVLIKIHATSLNAYDWHFLTADIFLIRLMGGGLLKPKYMRLGADIAGRVEAVGSNVRQFQAGDEVFGYQSVHLAKALHTVPVLFGNIVLRSFRKLMGWQSVYELHRHSRRRPGRCRLEACSPEQRRCTLCSRPRLLLG